MTNRCAFLVVLTAFAGLGTVLKDYDRPVKKELQKLQGTWRLVSLTVASGKRSDEHVKGFRLTLKGNTFQCADGGGTIWYKGTYEIIEVRGRFRKSNLWYTKPEDWAGKVVPQFAEWLDPDTFRVRVPYPLNKDLTRPTGFTLREESDDGVFLFKREKK